LGAQASGYAATAFKQASARLKATKTGEILYSRPFESSAKVAFVWFRLNRLVDSLLLFLYERYFEKDGSDYS